MLAIKGPMSGLLPQGAGIGATVSHVTPKYSNHKSIGGSSVETGIHLPRGGSSTCEAVHCDRSREILIARMRRPRKIQHAMRVLRSCRVQRTFHLATVRFGLGEAR
jgi:hypothetical protein